MMNNNNLYDVYDNYSRELTFDSFIKKVFLHMALALIITSLISYLCYKNIYGGGFMLNILIKFPYIVFVLAITELIIAFTIPATLRKLSYNTILILFYLYAVLTGVSFSSIFIAYDIGNIFMAFIFASGFFISMLAIGKTTKLDLTKFRTIFIAGMIALLLMSIISMFIGISGLDILISWVGLGLFLGITAYDIQKLRDYYYQSALDGEFEHKLSIYCAFDLYLDFINIFIYVLRIMSRRRRD